MKRVSVFILSFLILFLAACSNPDPGESTTKEATKEHFLGIWVDDAKTCALSFSKDDSQLVQARPDGNMQVDFLDYEVEKGELVLKFRIGKTMQLPFSFIEEDEVQITWEDGNKTVFIRQEKE